MLRWPFVVLCLFALALGVEAQEAEHATDAARARTIEVTATGATVREAPSVHAPRRGTIRVGTRLPYEARVMGTGCPGGGWYRLADEAYLCQSLAEPTSEPPMGDALPVVPAGQMLPRQYAFVATDGTWAYTRPGDYFQDDYAESLGRGFGLAIVERRVVSGVPLLRTLSGLWVPEDDVRFAHGSEFAGVELDGALDVAWVLSRHATIRAWNGRRAGAVVRTAGEREVLRVREVMPHGQLRIALDDGSDGVIAAREVARPTISDPPSEAGTGERWIDVELGSQTLVVYDGTRPVFATLVSTGRAGPAHTTPTGTFRIWVKLAEDTMDDLPQTDQESNYAIEGVPWVQYFSHGVALHAAFWHDQFGHPHSHGCVNLSPRDARRVFGMTEPQLPAGWDAILTTDAHPGTLVRVRREPRTGSG